MNQKDGLVHTKGEGKPFSRTPCDVEADTDRLPIIEERIDVHVEEREVGSVRVRTTTQTDLQEVPVVSRRKSVHVERVAVCRYVDSEFEPRQEGDTMIVPVFEYVPVVVMKLMLKEEIHITTSVTEQQGVHGAEVRRQEVTIERRSGVNGDWVMDPGIASLNTSK